MNRFTTLTALALSAGLAMGAGPGRAQDYDPETLRVALLPDENASTVIQDNEALAAHLESALDREIELIVTTDYSSMIEAMRFGRIELAYFGPASYTIAREAMEGGELQIEPFAARLKDGGTTYQSVIIANAETDIQSITDIEGSGIVVAYGDPASTSSHFAPRYTMIQAGVDAGEDYTAVHVGSHDAVAVNVQQGNAPVGGLSRPILESLIERGIIDESRIRVIAYSDPLPQYPWVMRTDLEPGLQQGVRNAFLGLEPGTPEGDAVLGPFGADGFAEITDADYDIIRSIRESIQ